MPNNDAQARAPIPESFWNEFQLHLKYIETRIVAPILRKSNVRDIEAQDICQEVFLKFYTEFHRNGTPVTNVQGLLVTMAKHMALNAIKAKRETLITHDYPEQDDIAAAVGKQVDVKLMKKELMQQLCNRFPKHALRDYKIIIYRWCFDMRYKDIAKQMGITQNIVLDTLKRKFADTIAPILQGKFPNQ